jgi:hypothetical protein
MSFQFRPATRESVGLLIGLAGGTGSGKTYSGMRLARGITQALGKKKFAVIDTEARRALHYADQFDFDHGELKGPFSPERYTEAIVAADDAGYPVILLDSASHVWAGAGGVLEMQEAELDRMAGQDYRKREACKMASWIKPKGSHKKMVDRLLQVRAHLILCFRAEPKIEMQKDPQTGKTVIVAKQSLTGLDGWIPISEKNLPFELTVSFLMMAANPGVGLPIKLQAQHRPMFPNGRVIDEESGRRITEWAAGGVPRAQPEPESAPGELNTDPALALASASLTSAAAQGMTQLLAAWQGLTDEGRAELGSLFGKLKKTAARA